MRHTLRRWIVAVALTAGALAGARPGGLAADEPGPMPVDDRPPAYILPTVSDPPIPSHLRPDPLLERPDMPLPGWFFDVDANIVQVRVRNQLTNNVTVSPLQTDTINFQGNPLDWTVSPRFEAGYHLADGLGDLQLGYRFLATSGGATIGTPAGAAGQHGRLDLNEFDLQYVSHEFSLAPLWEMRWNFGARAATLYFDSRLSFLNAAPGPGAPVTQDETNFLHAYGPLAGLELARHSAVPGLSFIGKLEAASLFGRIKQTFGEEVAGNPTASGLTRQQASVGVPTLNGIIGLSYDIPRWQHSRVLVGYEFETWWQIGRLNDSRGQLDLQGLFLRAEIAF